MGGFLGKRWGLRRLEAGAYKLCWSSKMATHCGIFSAGLLSLFHSLVSPNVPSLSGKLTLSLSSLGPFSMGVLLNGHSFASQHYSLGNTQQPPGKFIFVFDIFQFLFALFPAVRFVWFRFVPCCLAVCFCGVN